MMRIITSLTLAVAFLTASFAHAINVSSGSLTTLPSFKSEYVKARDVHVWLPEGYNDKTKYAVIYMHDGQMLFDANTTWNKQEWGADEVAGELTAQNKVKPFIIVGVNNIAERRHNNYFPQSAFEMLTKEQQQTLFQEKKDADTLILRHSINSDDYLKFLVNELKPYIDEHYAVDGSQASTFILGSSMGGLISMYAISEYPNVFGGAACLSTHWPGVTPHDGNPVPDIFVDYMKKNLPDPQHHKIYFDYGDQTLDAFYPPLQKKVDEVMKAKGYGEEQWQTLFFKGQDHSENAWKSRLDKPILFLLGK